MEDIQNKDSLEVTANWYHKWFPEIDWAGLSDEQKQVLHTFRISGASQAIYQYISQLIERV